MTKHTCHAVGCSVPIPARLLMCAHHWYRVPRPLRDRVWAAYRRGQEVTKDPSDEWWAAAHDAIRAVAAKEGER